MTLEKKISELVIESKELGYTKPGNYIYEFLSELNITSETSKKLIETIDSASLLLEEGNCFFWDPSFHWNAPHFLDGLVS